jgi:hypothetical protein
MIKPMARPVPLFLILAALLLAATGAAAGDAVAGEEESRPICAVCDRPIDGDFVETQGKTYHPGHFLCGHCKLPIGSGSYVIHEKEKYHPHCYEEHVALRCALGDGIIDGKYLRDHWGNVYHLSHERDADQCDYCQRFISGALTGGGYEYDDGRIICGLCARSAVNDVDKGEKLMAEVARHLRRIGLTVDLESIRLRLVGLERMRRLAAASSHDLKGYTHYIRYSSSTEGESDSISTVYILHGMPRVDAIATLAHELTHVWQLTEGRKENDDALCEGSSNYAGYLVLKEYPGPETEFLIKKMVENRDPVYGEGFRRVKRFAEERTVEEWIRLLRSRERLPPGY